MARARRIRGSSLLCLAILWAGAASAQKPASPSPALTVGQKAAVPDWQWVEPVSLPDDASASATLGRRNCTIQAGAAVTVLDFSPDRRAVLVRYVPGEPQYGTSCPPGTVFRLDAQRLADAEEARLQAELERAARRREAEGILAGKSGARPEGAPATGQVLPLRWRYVDVVAPARNADMSFAPGERCLIQNGAAAVLGFSADSRRVLLRCETTGAQYGTTCPSGVLFFLAVEDLSSPL